jgi:hypothetical protein
MLLGEAKQEATAGSIIIGKQHQEANTRNNNTQQHGAASGSNMRKQQHKTTTGRSVNKNNKEENNY